jgi:hypothetical protein
MDIILLQAYSLGVTLIKWVRFQHLRDKWIKALRLVLHIFTPPFRWTKSSWQLLWRSLGNKIYESTKPVYIHFVLLNFWSLASCRRVVSNFGQLQRTWELTHPQNHLFSFENGVYLEDHPRKDMVSLPDLLHPSSSPPGDSFLLRWSKCSELMSLSVCPDENLSHRLTWEKLALGTPSFPAKTRVEATGYCN